MSWSDVDVERMKALWAEGHSATHIAKVLKRVSGNAVLGKLHRLGLLKRAPPTDPAQPRSARSSAALAAPKPPRPERKPSAPRSRLKVVGSGQGLRAVQATVGDEPVPPTREADVARLAEPRTGCCKWPVGDPRRSGFGFCGLPAGERSYCDAHTARAFIGPQRSLNSLPGWVDGIEGRGWARDRREAERRRAA